MVQWVVLYNQRKITNPAVLVATCYVHMFASKSCKCVHILHIGQGKYGLGKRDERRKVADEWSSNADRCRMLTSSRRDERPGSNGSTNAARRRNPLITWSINQSLLWLVPSSPIRLSRLLYGGGVNRVEHCTNHAVVVMQNTYVPKRKPLQELFRVFVTTGRVHVFLVAKKSGKPLSLHLSKASPVEK